MPNTDDHPANVIWIITDQMRAQATGYAGDPNVSTPNLDRLAAEGANFTRAVSGSPLCCPFRGALVTGRYPHNNGVAGFRDPLPQDTATVAHAFNDAGYRTCYVGKWHLDGDRPGCRPRVGRPDADDSGRTSWRVHGLVGLREP